jgi:hypothetical protein
MPAALISRRFSIWIEEALAALSNAVHSGKLVSARISGVSDWVSAVGCWLVTGVPFWF